MKSKVIQTVIFVLALVAALALSINSTVLGAKATDTFEANSFITVMNLFLVISLLCAIVYMVMGANKENAIFYKLFMWSYVIAEGSMIVSTMITGKVPSFLVLPYIVGFTMAIILTTSKDLGKRSSIVTAVLAIGSKIVVVVYDIVIFGTLSQSDALMFLGSELSRLMLAVTACMLVLAKYRDKDARGTK